MEWKNRCNSTSDTKLHWNYEITTKMKIELYLSADNYSDVLRLIDCLQSFELILLATIWFKIFTIY